MNFFSGLPEFETIFRPDSGERENNLRFTERRKNPRIDYTIPLDLSVGDRVATSKMLNLSRAGVLCRVGFQIPLMTQLGVVFKLSENDEEEETDQYISCAGIVVRNEEVVSETNQGAEYEIAIFFYDIESLEEKKIDNFIEQKLKKFYPPPVEI